MKKFFGILFLILIIAALSLSTSQESQAQTSETINANFFVHTATPENSVAYVTTLDHPLLNGNPDAVLIVTQNWNPGGVGGVYNDHAIGVYYIQGQWRLYTESQATIPENASFNVYIAGEGDEAITHVHTADNAGYNETILDHPKLNNRPDQIPFLSLIHI